MQICRDEPTASARESMGWAWNLAAGNLKLAAAPFPSAQNKTPTAFAIGVLEFNLDDDLLSHGETPHYHRRCIVSLLSSGWDQVVPTLYGRQEIRVLSRDQMASHQQIGYVIASVFCELRTFGSFRLHTPQSGLFRLFN